MWLLTGDEDWKQVKVASSKVISENKFELSGEEGTYHFRAAAAEEWVSAVQANAQ